MALNLLKGKEPDDIFSSDIEALRQISADKLPDILKLVSEYALDRMPMDLSYVEKFAKQIKINRDLLLRALRVISRMSIYGIAIKKEDLLDDLQKLKLSNEAINQILNFIEANKNKISVITEEVREEAVPSLRDLNWRVDIRYASGDFLREPTVYALMRMQVHDGTQTNEIYVELDKDDLSWFEKTLSNIKTKFLEAEKIKEKMLSASSDET